LSLKPDPKTITYSAVPTLKERKLNKKDLSYDIITYNAEGNLREGSPPLKISPSKTALAYFLVFDAPTPFLFNLRRFLFIVFIGTSPSCFWNLPSPRPE